MAGYDERYEARQAQARAHEQTQAGQPHAQPETTERRQKTQSDQASGNNQQIRKEDLNRVMLQMGQLTKDAQMGVKKGVNNFLTTAPSKIFPVAGGTGGMRGPVLGGGVWSKMRVPVGM